MDQTVRKRYLLKTNTLTGKKILLTERKRIESDNKIINWDNKFDGADSKRGLLDNKNVEWLIMTRNKRFTYKEKRKELVLQTTSLDELEGYFFTFIRIWGHLPARAR
ncbi:hypothetical protein [Metabacillus arenae]|uniref:Uncharacterized protein n=1 Tax=Metabacillus arenae TaxID=2771434 RepID=A0A926NM13_9BACI|nr:hypothetical protein [Metabacillus arenae]MBD1383560.1 hypothetical protein [Metabacillus arenae]